jgi:GTPase
MTKIDKCTPSQLLEK